jgi:hypothetical protein
MTVLNIRTDNEARNFVLFFTSSRRILVLKQINLDQRNMRRCPVAADVSRRTKNQAAWINEDPPPHGGGYGSDWRRFAALQATICIKLHFFN